MDNKVLEGSLVLVASKVLGANQGMDNKALERIQDLVGILVQVAHQDSKDSLVNKVSEDRKHLVDNKDLVFSLEQEDFLDMTDNQVLQAHKELEVNQASEDIKLESVLLDSLVLLVDKLVRLLESRVL